jgi:hypothetical protein
MASEESTPAVVLILIKEGYTCTQFISLECSVCHAAAWWRLRYAYKRLRVAVTHQTRELSMTLEELCCRAQLHQLVPL